MDPTIDAVEVLLTTGGMPMNARIEILQGPDTNKEAGPRIISKKWCHIR